MSPRNAPRSENCRHTQKRIFKRMRSTLCMAAFQWRGKLIVALFRKLFLVLSFLRRLVLPNCASAFTSRVCGLILLIPNSVYFQHVLKLCWAVLKY